MHRGGLIALVVAVAGTLTACSAEVLVTAERTDEIGVDDPATTSTLLPDDGTGDPTDDDPTGTSPTDDPDPEAIDFGPNKPPRAYDEFLLAVMTDIELWWTAEYPAYYGGEFTPLEGAVYAAYPERPDDIPGCGAERTTYQEVREYAAFYCAVGDFMVYDDGEDGLLAQLARDHGAATIGTVLAHEYGHAVQLRAGALDDNLPTIRTEQQADCFAGAWTARVANGQSTLVNYSDGDVRSGLIAMTRVSDPVGLDQFVPGGHGSAFDRVGAFQVGFVQGLARCVELLDDPLPLVPNQFTTADPLGGDANFGYAEGELMNFLPTDLNQYWDEELSGQVPDFEALTLVPVQSVTDADCDDLRPLGTASALCADTGEVYLNEPVARELYDALGDFSIGYVLGLAWSEGVLEALGADAEGEERSLLIDCLTGGWVKTVVPVATSTNRYELPQPRLENRTVSVSAGDLDEAIQTVLLVADASGTDDEVGTAFDKIEAFRLGVIEGTDACLAQL